MSHANPGSERVGSGITYASPFCSHVMPRFVSTPPGGSDIVRYCWFFPKDGNAGVQIGYDSNNKPRYAQGVWNYVPTALTTPAK